MNASTFKTHQSKVITIFQLNFKGAVHQLRDRTQELALPRAALPGVPPELGPTFQAALIPIFRREFHFENLLNESLLTGYHLRSFYSFPQ